MSKIRNIKKKILVNVLITVVLLSCLLVFPASAASSWSKPRPSSYTPYYETIGNAYTDSVASVGMGVEIYEYVERPIGYADVLTLRISVSANTREGIQYDVGSLSYNWYTVSNSTGITGDDAGVWLNLPFPVLYYGVEYTKVWVCSNGFLSFDYPATTPTPESIPNTNKPNSTVAPFWRDLNPAAGGSITYGYIGASQYGPLFVISWNNVPNKGNGVPQTFQAVIPFPQSGGYGWYHNWIIFQYKSITKEYTTTVGIEDQTGNKATSYNYNQLSNQAALVFIYDSLGCRLEQLKITLTKSDSYAKIIFVPLCVGGYNVILNNTQNGMQDFYTSAIEFAGSLLVGLLAPPAYAAKAGIVYGILLVCGHGAAAALSAGLSEPDYTVDHAAEYENVSYVKAPAQAEAYYLSPKPFDSTLAATVEWHFLDPNNRSHYTAITAEATYKDLSQGTLYNISTSVSLSMTFVNSPPNTPSTPSGPTSGIWDKTYTYSTKTTDPNGNQIWYEFSWGDGKTTTVGPYASGVTASASHCWGADGSFYVKVRAKDSYGAWSGWSGSLKVTLTYTCPTLFSWNGSAFEEEGLLDIHAPSDVTVDYDLSHLTPLGKLCLLSLRELDNYTSHIDYVKLFAVDAQGNRYECRLTFASHSQLGPVTTELRYDDNTRVDLTPGQTTALMFTIPSDVSNVQGFVFEINGYNPKPQFEP